MEEQLVVEQAVTHIRANTVKARDGQKCIDGRYQLAVEYGKVAIPGGDFGDIITLLAVNKADNLGLTVDQCVDAVYAIAIQTTGAFGMHTDLDADPVDGHHNQGEKPLVGCGHIAKAADPGLARNYLVDHEQVLQALAYAKEKLAAAHIEIVALPRERAEQGVLVNTGTEYTVNPSNRSQYFIFDVARQAQRVRSVLVPQLNKALERAISADRFINVHEEQAAATLRCLALGKPMIKFNADGPQPTAAYAGRVA
jgi:hypothetical protein